MVDYSYFTADGLSIGFNCALAIEYTLQKRRKMKGRGRGMMDEGLEGIRGWGIKRVRGEAVCRSRVSRHQASARKAPRR